MAANARRRILVTGCQGFIGSHLTLGFLARGHDVVTMDAPGHGDRRRLMIATAAGARGFTADLCDPALRSILDEIRPDTVVHTIERADARRALGDPVGDAHANLVGSLNLLEACRYAGVSKIVVTTSALRLFGKTPLPAGTVYGPADTPCGIARRAVLEYLDLYHDRFGLDWVVLALGNVYGPGQAPGGDETFIANFLDALARGHAATLPGDGSQTRDFVFVGDVVEATALALARGTRDVIPIGTGVERSLREAYEACGSVTGTDAPPLCAEQPEGLTERFFLDPSPAGTSLRFRALTSLEAGVALTASGTRERRPLPTEAATA